VTPKTASRATVSRGMTRPSCWTGSALTASTSSFAGTGWAWAFAAGIRARAKAAAAAPAVPRARRRSVMRVERTTIIPITRP
jgi:hypothetical protein